MQPIKRNFQLYSVLTTGFLLWIASAFYTPDYATNLIPTIKVVNAKCEDGSDPAQYTLRLRAIADTLFIDPNPNNLVIEKNDLFDYEIDGVPSGEPITIKAEVFETDSTFVLNYNFECPDFCLPLNVDKVECLPDTTSGYCVTIKSRADSIVTFPSDLEIFFYNDSVFAVNNIELGDSVRILVFNAGICYETTEYLEECCPTPTDPLSVEIRKRPDTICCPGDSINLIGIPDTVQSFTFAWATNPEFDPIIGEDPEIDIIVENSPITYYFRLSSLCEEAIDSFTVKPDEGCEPCKNTLSAEASTIDGAKEAMICMGSCDTLIAKGMGTQPPFTYQWFDNPELTGDPISTDSIIVVCPSENTTYYVEINDTEGTNPDCIDGEPTDPVIDSVLVTVKPRPTINLVQVDSNMCDAGTYCATIRTENADSISTAPGEYNIALTAPGIYIICGIPAGTDLEVTAVNECGIDTLTVPDPCKCRNTLTGEASTIDGDKEAIICIDSCVILVASATGTQPDFTFEWFDNPELSGDPIGTIDTLEVCPRQTTRYYLVVNDTEGSNSDCVDGEPTPAVIDSVLVTVLPKPTISLVGMDTTMCDEGSYCATVRVENADLNSINTSPENLTIMPVDGQVGVFEICDVPTGTELEITAANECGTDTLSISDPCKCSNTLTAEASTIDGAKETVICIGSCDTLIARAMGTQPPFTYRWFDNAQLVGDPISVDDLIVVCPSETTTYYVEVNDTEGTNPDCIDGTPTDPVIDSVVVIVQPVPTITLIGVDTTMCGQGSYCATFRVENAESISTLPGEYTIMPVGGQPGVFEVCDVPKGTNLIVTAVNECGTSTQTVPDPCECRNTLSVDAKTIIGEDAATICIDSCTILVANAMGDQPPFTYEWFDDPDLSGDPISMNDTLEVCPMETTMYYVVVNDTEGSNPECVNGEPTDPIVDSILVTVNPKPTLEILETFCDNPTEQTYCVTISTDADLIMASPDNLNITRFPDGSTATICGIPLNTMISIEVSFDETGCVRDTMLTIENPLNISVQADPSATLCIDTCTNLSVSINGGTPPYTIGWFDNAECIGEPLGDFINLEVCPEVNTTYYVKVDDEDECTPTVIDSITVVKREMPPLVCDTVFCEGLTYCAIIQTEEDAIVTNSGDFPLDTLGIGRYQICGIPADSVLTITAFVGSQDCSNSIEVRGTCCPEELVVIVSETEIPDCIDPALLPIEVTLAAINTGGASELDISWYTSASFPDSAIAVGEILTISIGKSDTIYAIVVDEREAKGATLCTDTAFFALPVSIAPDLTCDGFSCSPDMLSYSVTGFTTGNSLIANSGNLTLNPDGTFLVEDIPSDVIAEITAVDTLTQCSVTRTKDPKAECCFPRPEVDAEAEPECVVIGGTTQLSAIIKDGYECVNCMFEWSPSESLDDPTSQNPIATPPAGTTTYTVTITDVITDQSASPCEDVTNTCVIGSGSVDVLALPCGPENIFLPNVFSPNEDGNNDELVLQIINVEKVEIVIFSRFGEVVVDFQWELPPGEDPAVDENGNKPKKITVWDGKVNGRVQNPEIFGFSMTATCIGGIEYKQDGNITLLR